MDTMKSVMQQAKDSSKQIFNQNVNVAKTIEQNTRDVAQAAQDANTRFNTSVNNSGSGSSSNTSGTTSSTTTYTSAA
jgi:gas vesicle protein